ncbi:hypothetical protein AB0P17_38810 [Streptomyces sp. NPDC088124]|uniref:hypothetical protein n=1 Tax=Streptomyces sp. NPDC088124 TaxID=3154654 RepID=UPI00343373CC
MTCREAGRVPRGWPGAAGAGAGAVRAGPYVSAGRTAALYGPLVRRHVRPGRPAVPGYGRLGGHP